MFQYNSLHAPDEDQTHSSAPTFRSLGALDIAILALIGTSLLWPQDS